MEEQKRLQDEMLSKAKAEELHLKMLQEEQNMNPGDKMTFAQQATKFMERAVGQMKMTTTEFFQCVFVLSKFFLNLLLALYSDKSNPKQECEWFFYQQKK